MYVCVSPQAGVHSLPADRAIPSRLKVFEKMQSANGLKSYRAFEFLCTPGILDYSSFL